MKDAKGHGSNTRGGPKLPRGTTAAYAGRDRLGRTYTAAVRDYDRFRSQNPDFPNAEDYRTDKTSNAQAAEALASTLKSTQAPVHSGTPGGSWVPPDVAARFKQEARTKKQFASGQREINRLKKRGK